VAVVEYTFTHKQYIEQHDSFGKTAGRATSLRVKECGPCRPVLKDEFLTCMHRTFAIVQNQYVYSSFLSFPSIEISFIGFQFSNFDISQLVILLMVCGAFQI